MWAQYRKTFWPTQTIIAATAIAVFVWSRLFAPAALFFFTMQIGAAIGGLWAGRLKRKFLPATNPPPACP